MPKYLVGLDIGSKNVCATMCSINSDDEFEILDFAIMDSVGIRKGQVVNSEEISNVVKECLEELQRKTGNDIKSVYLGIGSKDCRIISNRGYKYIDYGEIITQNDIAEAYINGKKINVEDDEYVVDGIVNSFYTAEHGFIDNPIGLTADRVEVNLDIIVAKKDLVSDLKSIVLNSGFEVEGVFLSVDTLKNIFLNEKTLLNNAAIINVGSEKTEIALYKSNKLKYTSFIPLGGRNISKDLSICLELSEEVSESLKVQCSKEYISMIEESCIEVNGKVIPCRFICEIIDARIDEILEYIKQEIINSGIYDDIDLLIISGEGICNFEYLDKKIREKFDKKVKIFTKNHFYFDKYSIIASIAIVKEAHDRLKLIQDKYLLSDKNNTVDNIEDVKNYKVKKRGFSRVKAFLEEIF